MAGSQRDMNLKLQEYIAYSQSKPEQSFEVAGMSGSTPITIRSATEADVPHIVRIGAETFAASFAHSMPAEHMQEYLGQTYTVPAMTAELADTKHSTFFVASSNHDILGFLQMKCGTTEPCVPQDRPTCELHRIYVSVDSLGRGVGQLLVQRGIDWATELRSVSEGSGIQSEMGIWLGVWDENLQAQKFYRRWGFERIGAHDFVIGDTRQTDLIMIRWLDSSSEEAKKGKEQES